jgi:prephenate dehydrogenase
VFYSYYVQQDQNKTSEVQQRADKIARIFDDPEAKRNIIGLYDLLLKIAKRTPELWAKIQQQNKYD